MPPTTTTQPSPLPQRLALHTLHFLLLTAALYIVPTLMHHAVTSLDSVYEVLGRRTRSPYTLSSVFFASVLLVGWHVWLGRLSYKTVVEGRKVGQVSWGRILGRVVVPGLVLVLGIEFAWEVSVKVVADA
jgi:hypothetical protein